MSPKEVEVHCWNLWY